MAMLVFACKEEKGRGEVGGEEEEKRRRGLCGGERKRERDKQTDGN